MTPPQPPAVRLRAAAALVRREAAATLGSDEPWRYAKGSPNDSVRTSVGWEVATSDNPNNLRWIALMGPAVGEPLAAWLDGEAARWDPEAGIQSWDASHERALAVADALLAVTR